jgi:hypothetical protein
MKYKAASSRKNRRARLTGFCPTLTHDLLDASHGSAFQTDFDPMRMRWGFGEDIFHNSLRQFAGALILLQDDEHGHARFNFGASLSIHKYFYVSNEKFVCLMIFNKADIFDVPDEFLF